MRLWMDSEFNGHNGELISLAFAAEDGKHWYGVRTIPEVLDPFVAEVVIPKLNRHPYVPPEIFRSSLYEYLHTRAGATIYADWPADFELLMRVMSGPSYEKSWVVPCTMVLLDQSEPKPAIPHNALSDAIALMEWHRGR